MNLPVFKISQSQNSAYDTYDSAIVVAENSEKAKLISPFDGDDIRHNPYNEYCWVTEPRLVYAEPISETSRYKKPTVICTSYNAG